MESEKVPEVPVSGADAASQASRKRWFDYPLLVLGALIFVWPVGVYGLAKSPWNRVAKALMFCISLPVAGFVTLVLFATLTVDWSEIETEGRQARTERRREEQKAAERLPVKGGVTDSGAAQHAVGDTPALKPLRIRSHPIETVPIEFEPLVAARKRYYDDLSTWMGSTKVPPLEWDHEPTYREMDQYIRAWGRKWNLLEEKSAGISRAWRGGPPYKLGRDCLLPPARSRCYVWMTVPAPPAMTTERQIEEIANAICELIVVWTTNDAFNALDEVEVTVVSVDPQSLKEFHWIPAIDLNQEFVKSVRWGTCADPKHTLVALDKGGFDLRPIFDRYLVTRGYRVEGG